MENAAIDETIITSLKQLEIPGEPVPFLDELIHIFLTDASLSSRNLSTAYTQKDWPNVNRWAHKLKGQARNLGANRLSDVCSNLEILASQTEKANADALIQASEDELKAAITALRGYLRTS
ncbi:MAG: Hpt domain-containing protein [Chitinophagaceae bacterium]|nr:Hpt domain-containing protein [Oligoflexus sp.]